GSSVTISGTGFSATASQDTVTFNGLAATVTSATANQLIVTLPSGATTGTISITTPSGTTTSAFAFTITTANLAPTITSFTPTIGISGAAVTVTGTNFDTLPANDRLSVNATYASPSSATATQLGISVPDAATSGHITVTTPFGTAVSSGDFFVPPSPHTAA